MSNTKNSKKKNNKTRDEFEERIMDVDVQYEDIPVDKKNPVIMKSRAIQTAHNMAIAGLITSVVPLLGLTLGILSFLKLKGLGQIPYDLKIRYASAKALSKGTIATGILAMFMIVFILTSTDFLK